LIKQQHIIILTLSIAVAAEPLTYLRKIIMIIEEIDFEENVNEKSLRSKRIKNKKAKDKALNRLEDKYKSPKKWKHMYLRSEKLRRAKQLGIEYPIISNAKLLKNSIDL
jgi:hypothetical protein